MRRPTVTLLVRERSQAGRDTHGNPVASWSGPEPVPGCLWAPGTPAEEATSVPEGADVTATAHFPPGWARRLRGALVSLDGDEWLDVIGEPHAYPAGALGGATGSCPWDTYALLGRTDGT